MKLENIIEICNSKNLIDVDVSIVCANNNYTSCSLADLIYDWWYDCNFVPENGELILNTIFSIDNKIYIMDNVLDIYFEDFMNNIMKIKNSRCCIM